MSDNDIIVGLPTIVVLGVGAQWVGPVLRLVTIGGAMLFGRRHVYSVVEAAPVAHGWRIGAEVEAPAFGRGAHRAELDALAQADGSVTSRRADDASARTTR